MLSVFDYITNYCAIHGIKRYSLKSAVITLSDFSQQQTFAPGVAFFYKVLVSGEIQNIANMSLPSLTIKTPTDYWDFSRIGIVRDDGVLQRLDSDFVFTADGIMNIDLQSGANALFSQIFSAQLFYIYLSILPEDKSEAQAVARPQTVYDIQVNQHI